MTTIRPEPSDEGSIWNSPAKQGFLAFSSATSSACVSPKRDFPGVFGVSFSSAYSMPMTVALNNLVSSSTGVKEYNVHFAGAILAALPTLIVYIVAGRYFVRGLMAGSVKG